MRSRCGSIGLALIRDEIPDDLEKDSSVTLIR
jgi:hypothetical protein